jgi:AcrR family transcriptional regulator
LPRSPAQNEAMRAQTRERIETAAVKLFARSGFAATSVRDIANEAGISTGLMYRHYRTKDELFGDLVAQAAQGLAEVVRTFRGDAPPAELIEAFTREVVDDIAADKGFAEFMLIMSQSFVMEDPPPQVRQLRRQNQALVRSLIELVERGQRLGQCVSGDASELATCYLAMLDGLATWKFAMPGRFVAPSPTTVAGCLLEKGPR